MYTMDDEDEDIWDLIIGVNLTVRHPEKLKLRKFSLVDIVKGVMHCIKAEVKHMKAGASIVNAASVAGISGAPNMAAYCASKHGVVGLTRVAAKDFGKRGIRVNAIAPGYVKSPMTAKIKEVAGDQVEQMSAQFSALGRVAEPEEMASVIAFLLSDDASYVSFGSSAK